jgi:hypothetical protein
MRTNLRLATMAAATEAAYLLTIGRYTLRTISGIYTVLDSTNGELSVASNARTR